MCTGSLRAGQLVCLTCLAQIPFGYVSAVLWVLSQMPFWVPTLLRITSPAPCPCPPAAVSGVYMIALWTLGLQKKPKVDAKFWKMIMPVAFFHTVGHVSACTSFGQMAVSFAHIVKSAEPVFSVALTGPILGDSFPIYVWLSLLPIVAGGLCWLCM